MQQSNDNLWTSAQTRQLVEVMSSIGDIQTMKNFIQDVMTEKEIIEISARLEAARMLSIGETYANIINKTKLSSRTVARISDWLKNGYSGYQAALKAVNAHSVHMPPVRAE